MDLEDFNATCESDLSPFPKIPENFGMEHAFNVINK